MWIDNFDRFLASRRYGMVDVGRRQMAMTAKGMFLGSVPGLTLDVQQRPDFMDAQTIKELARFVLGVLSKHVTKYSMYTYPASASKFHQQLSQSCRSIPVCLPGEPARERANLLQRYRGLGLINQAIGSDAGLNNVIQSLYTSTMINLTKVKVVVSDCNIWFRILRLLHAKNSPAHGLRGYLQPCLGTWHLYKQTCLCLWRKYLHTVFGPMTHHVTPEATILLKPKLTVISEAFTRLMAVFQDRNVIKLWKTVMRGIPMDREWQSQRIWMMNLLTLARHFIPIVSWGCRESFQNQENTPRNIPKWII